MSNLRLPGISTGIDTTKIIDQLMAIEGRRLAKYQVEKKGYEQKTTALDELRSQVRTLNSAVAGISSASALKSFRTNSSDNDILTISASSNASAGSHSIVVNQLASTDAWIQDDSGFTYETDYVGAGNFIYSYNHEECVIPTIAEETTLEDLVNLINNDNQNPGVTAGLLYQGGSYHLMLNGRESGADYQISITTSNTEVWQGDSAFTKNGSTAELSTRIVDLDDFEGSGDDLQGDEFINISGKKHDGTAVNQNFAVNKNSTLGHLIDKINDAYGGTATAKLVNGKIKLVDNTCGASQMELSSLTYDQGSGTTNLTTPTFAQSTQGGSKTANLAGLQPGSFIENQSAQDSRIRVDGYPPPVAEIQTLTPDNPATGGTFTLSYGTEETDPIAYNATADQIQTALEALSNVNSGDIIVAGDPLDTNPVADGLTFTFRDTAGDVDMLSFDFSGLTGTTQAGSSIDETPKGRYEWIETSSNNVTWAGITINLHNVTAEDETVEITVTKDTSTVRSKVQSVATAYNNLITFLEEKTEYDPDTKKMGILSQESALAFIKTNIKSPFIGTATGFSDEADSFIRAQDIGISIGADRKMEIDNSKLNEAIEEDFDGVADLLAASAKGNSDSDYILFYEASTYTTPGEYDVKVQCDVAGTITGAWIKLGSEDESDYRQATVNGDIISGTMDFNSDDPEKALKLKFEWDGVNQEFTAVVRVKQGIGLTLDESLDSILKIGTGTDTGRLNVAEKTVDDKIDQLEDKIESEEKRLEKTKARLVAKYTRLEKVLTQLQQQFGALAMLEM